MKTKTHNSFFRGLVIVSLLTFQFSGLRGIAQSSEHNHAPVEPNTSHQEHSEHKGDEAADSESQHGESHGVMPETSKKQKETDPHAGHGNPSSVGEEKSSPSLVEGRGQVMLSSTQRQLINIRVKAAHRQQAAIHMRTVGLVVYDDTRIENINTKIMGWADVLHVDKPGQRVEKGEPLLEIYSPELYSAQQEYLIAYDHCSKLGHLEEGGARPVGTLADILVSGRTLLDSAKKRLKLWDITDAEIDALEKAGVPSDRIQIRSPASGFVINKNIDPGQMTRPGMTLYRIANMDTVWINADVYEYELPLFVVGQKAKVIAKAYPDKRFEATVDFIYPFSEVRTRTTTARLVMDNSEGLLKPGMYVDVEIERDLGEQLLVPKEAVFDTGKRQYIFVESHPGHFEPKPVELGSKVDDHFVVRRGLSEGELVVVDGNFLLDSESQLKALGDGGVHNH